MNDVERARAELEHDLVEPLRTVSGFLELLDRRASERLHDDEREFLRRALDGIARLRELVDSSRDGAPASADLTAIVGGALRGLDALVDEREAHVAIEPLPVVPGNAAALGRLFQNLLANAIRYTEPHVTPHVEVSAQRDGERWAIVIADNGVGLETIDGSVGLGLAVAQRVANEHGGTLHARPRSGRSGTELVVTLPAG